MILLHDHMTGTTFKKIINFTNVLYGKQIWVFSDYPSQMYKVYESGINY